MKKISELIDLLSLEKIEENIFRGQNYQTPWKRVFGGQVLAQALHAAMETVPEDRIVHSIHGYFILTGDISQPIIYDVDRIRDGGSFTTRRVVAIQKGRPIFNMAASFQVPSEGFDHQIPMPNVPPPEALMTDEQRAEKYKKTSPILYKRYSIPRPIDFRPVEEINPLKPKNMAPFRHIWLKAKDKINGPLSLHQQILAYASDYNLLGTATLPHRKEFKLEKMFLASLDHAMWFHREFRADEWLLYVLDSPSASNERGFTRGNIFSQDGVLVASVVQEGLIREWKKK